jgi:hypothetical protein
MSHKPDDPLNDSALEHEIESLLAIEPSPEFVARVRTRIANEPEPSRWRLAWVVVPAMGMCIVLFVSVMGVWSRPEPPAPVQAVTPSPVPPTIVEREPAVELPRAVARVAAQKRVQRAAVADPFPEVVISEDERRAFANLLLAVQQERLPALVRAEDEIKEPLVPALLEIERLTIEPLQVTRLE